ncbi:MAG: hypothetical protein KDN19_09260 [Verrucomicrobiae bacterium]|nr:hypothetical protein [Verrucomicrobiae bacterium]
MASGITLGLLGCLFGLGAVLYLVVVPWTLKSVSTYSSSTTVTATPGAPTGSAAVPDLDSMNDYLTRLMWVAGLTFTAVSLIFLVAAYGSIFLKRWSRPLAIFLSGSWLYIGLVYMASLVIFSGPMQQDMREQMAEAGAGAPSGSQMFGIIMVVGMAFIFVFGIALPALILWLNWHRDVALTLEYADRKPRWTDRCPIPILCLVFACILIAVFTGTSPFLGALPLFGHIFVGSSIYVIWAVIALALFGIAWGLYRLKITAWAALVVLVVAGIVSTILTTLNADYQVIYEQMGMPEELIDQSLNSIQGTWQSPRSIIIMLVSALPILGYLIWCFRFFRPASNSAIG